MRRACPLQCCDCLCVHVEGSGGEGDGRATHRGHGTRREEKEGGHSVRRVPVVRALCERLRGCTHTQVKALRLPVWCVRVSLCVSCMCMCKTLHVFMTSYW